MSRLFPRLMLIVAIGMTGAACQDGGYGAPRGYNLAQTGYGNPNYNNGYYGPRPGQSQNGYSQQPGYTTVIVTNRGQNGNRGAEISDCTHLLCPCGDTKSRVRVQPLASL